MENKTVTEKAEGCKAAEGGRDERGKRIEVECRVPRRFVETHRLFVERVTERVVREIADEAADMMTALGAAMRVAAEAARPDMAGGDAPAPREKGGDAPAPREDGHADREERGDGE